MQNNDIIEYNLRQTDPFHEVCDLLMEQISAVLISAKVKLYHANPVWFIDDNPIVGYDVSQEHVNILFWSGQSFVEPGLRAVGKFKAAGTSYEKVCDINLDQLHAWLAESMSIQWNYRDLRKNNGELVMLSLHDLF